MLQVLLSGMVEVVQGPPWLVDLLYNPPWWLFALVNYGGLAMGLSFAGLAAHVGIDNEIVGEMATNGSIVVCIGVATHLSTKLLAQPYLVDVCVGFILGAVVSLGLLKPVITSAFDVDGNDDAEERDSEDAEAA